MEPATPFIVLTLVSSGVGLVFALTLYFRGRMDSAAFGFTAIVFFGLAFAGVNRLVDTPKPWYWLAISLVWIGLYKLGRRRLSNLAGPDHELGSIPPRASS